MHDFLNTLALMRAGEAIEEMQAELDALVTAVRETGAKGALTIKIEVKPASRGDTFALTIADTIAVKLPKRQTGETIMYALEGGRLTRRDPRQPDLPMPRAVEPINRDRSA